MRQVFFNGLFVVCFFTSVSGCVTSGKSFDKARVVERIGDSSETPAWAYGETTMTEENGEVYFINQISMSGNSRTEACVSAAETSARAGILRYVKDNLTTSGQLNETDTQSDPAVESLTAFLSQGKLSGVKTAARYWEKREESSEAGERVLRLRCVAKVAIKKAELERQLRAAMDGEKGNPKIREKLLKAQTDFIDGLAQESGPAKAPAEDRSSSDDAKHAH